MKVVCLLVWSLVFLSFLRRNQSRKKKEDECFPGVFAKKTTKASSSVRELSARQGGSCDNSLPRRDSQRFSGRTVFTPRQTSGATSEELKGFTMKRAVSLDYMALGRQIFYHYWCGRVRAQHWQSLCWLQLARVS